MRTTIATISLLLGVACQGGSDEKAPAAATRLPPLSEPAALQMREACSSWVAHACGCAAARPADAALAEQCALSRTIPDALELAIASTRADGHSSVDQTGLLANVNKIQKNCVEESARLETSCPRPSVPASTGAARGGAATPLPAANR